MASAFFPSLVRLLIPRAERLTFLGVRNIGALPCRQRAIQRLVAVQIKRDLVQRIQQHIAVRYADKHAGKIKDRTADADGLRFFSSGNPSGKLYFIRLRNKRPMRFLYGRVIAFIVILIIVVFHRHRHIAIAAGGIGRKSVRRFIKVHVWLSRNIDGKNPFILQSLG